jgi:hypothetical protein
VVLPLLVLLHPKKKRGVDHSLFDKDEDDSNSGNEKEDKERDYVPVTNQAVNYLMEGKNVWDLAAIITSHKKAFMERASPSGKEKITSTPRVRVLPFPRAGQNWNLTTSSMLSRIGKWVFRLGP